MRGYKTDDFSFLKCGIYQTLQIEGRSVQTKRMFPPWPARHSNSPKQDSSLVEIRVQQNRWSLTLMRLHTATGGEVLFDGVDLLKLSKTIS